MDDSFAIILSVVYERVMTTLLALDTATEACSVALLYQGKTYHHSEVIPRLHAQKLLPMIQQVIAEAGITLSDLDALAFGRGPGAFTGLRIATGVVQGLAFALDRPVIAISNLALLAQSAWRLYQAEYVAAAIDARMDEIYWGCYQLQNGEMCLLEKELVIAPELVKLTPALMEKPWFGAGSGWRYSSIIPMSCHKVDISLLPDAQDLLTLGLLAWQRGEVLAAEEASPIYLRDNVATPKKYSY